MSGTTETELLEANLLPPAEIYRAYDIRGLYGTQLTESGVELIGTAIGSEALSQGIDTLVLGRDGRLSSPSLAKSLVQGIQASGCSVVDLGVVPTPVVYFATHTTQWRSGVMLTASHNPAEYNGIKIVFDRSCLANNQIQDIRHRIENNLLSHGHGSYQKLDIVPDYLHEVRDRVQLRKPIKIAIDCANGVTSVLAQAFFEVLGCEVTPLFCELDGRFPNHDPDPTRAQNLAVLSQTVRDTDAEIGLAFDGDGDRLVVVDNQGTIIDTDLLLAALIKNIVPGYPGAKVIYDVKCSCRLAQLIESCGAIPVMHRSGHSFMKQKMQETNAPLGGEFSAHIFIKDRWFGFDDGMYTAARVLEILSLQDSPSSELFMELGERVSTPELSICVPESEKFGLMDEIERLADFTGAEVSTIDGVRASFADGWGLVRASNTSPSLLLRFEANSEESMQNIKSQFKQLLRQVDRSLPIDF